VLHRLGWKAFELRERHHLVISNNPCSSLADKHCPFPQEVFQVLGHAPASKCIVQWTGFVIIRIIVRTRVSFLGCKMMEGLTLIGVFREGTTLTC
jgi:hypothetical protein